MAREGSTYSPTEYDRVLGDFPYSFRPGPGDADAWAVHAARFGRANVKALALELELTRDWGLSFVFYAFMDRVVRGVAARGGIDPSAARHNAELAPTLRGLDETFAPALKRVLANVIGPEAADRFKVYNDFDCGLNCVYMSVEAYHPETPRETWAVVQRLVTTRIREKNAVRVLEKWFDTIVWRPGSARMRALQTDFDVAVEHGV